MCQRNEISNMYCSCKLILVHSRRKPGFFAIALVHDLQTFQENNRGKTDAFLLSPPTLIGYKLFPLSNKQQNVLTRCFVTVVQMIIPKHRTYWLWITVHVVLFLGARVGPHGAFPAITKVKQTTATKRAARPYPRLKLLSYSLP